MFNKKCEMVDEYDEYGVNKGTPTNFLPGGLVVLAVIAILILNHCGN